jgi:RNA polymerase sigma factor (sigma-70 family)
MVHRKSAGALARMNGTSGRAAPTRNIGLADTYSEFVSKFRRSRYRRAPDGEDVVQDACVRVLQLEHADSISDPVRYLLRVARNLVVDRYRSRLRAPEVFDSSNYADASTASSSDPEQILAGRQQLEIVLAAIQRLPPRCAEAFNLHRFAGLSYAAIARRMGVSTSMVEKHIAEAMLRLSQALARAIKPDRETIRAPSGRIRLKCGESSRSDQSDQNLWDGGRGVFHETARSARGYAGGVSRVCRVSCAGCIE